MTLFAQERHNAIKKIVRENRRMNFAGLRRLVDVSPATLRRDLAEMERAGEIIRVHGGVLDPAYARAEITLDERVVKNRAAKRAIAAAAADLVPSGATVLVDAGSTCLELGKALLGRKDVRLITHSVALVETAFRGEASVICLGGELRRVSGALIGAAALGALARVHADFAFVGASGLEAQAGCSTTELSEAEMKKAILTAATRKVLLADYAKWEQPSTVRFAPWDVFDDWITDQLPESDGVKKLRAAGVKIRLA